MPASAKLAMARLTASAAPAAKGGGKGAEKAAPAKLAAKPLARHTDRLAGIY